MTTTCSNTSIEPLQLGPFSLRSRLIVGTGKYETWDVMRDALDASGADAITVAVRRERLLDAEGRARALVWVRPQGGLSPRRRGGT